MLAGREFIVNRMVMEAAIFRAPVLNHQSSAHVVQKTLSMGTARRHTWHSTLVVPSTIRLCVTQLAFPRPAPMDVCNSESAELTAPHIT